MKKWSQIFDSGTRSPIFGHLKMGTFGIFGLLSYKYNLHQVGLEFRQPFDILVHPNLHPVNFTLLGPGAKDLFKGWVAGGKDALVGRYLSVDQYEGNICGKMRGGKEKFCQVHIEAGRSGMDQSSLKRHY